jgi:hypothetical protein
MRSRSVERTVLIALTAFLELVAVPSGPALAFASSAPHVGVVRGSECGPH